MSQLQTQLGLIPFGLDLSWIHSIQRVLKSLFLCSSIALSLSSILTTRVFSKSWSRKWHPRVSVFMWWASQQEVCASVWKVHLCEQISCQRIAEFLKQFFYLLYLLPHFQVKNKKGQTGWRTDIHIGVERLIIWVFPVKYDSFLQLKLELLWATPN